MKASPSILLLVAIPLIAACEKRAPEKNPHDPKPAGAGPTESQLKEAKKRLETEVTAEKRRITELDRDIQELRQELDERNAELKYLEEEKKRIAIDLKKLKERWTKETEGIDGCVDRPIHEIFRSVYERMDQMLRENEELKKRLKALGE
jgi:peptidoglycan hydrolase CwlO-like protein